MKAAKAIIYFLLILQLTDFNRIWKADKRITQAQEYTTECWNPPNLELSSLSGELKPTAYL